MHSFEGLINNARCWFERPVTRLCKAGVALILSPYAQEKVGWGGDLRTDQISKTAFDAACTFRTPNTTSIRLDRASSTLNTSPPPFEPRFLRRKNARHDVPQRKSHAQTPSTHHGSGISTTRTVVDGLRELTCVRHCLRAMPFGRHAVAFRWRFLKKGAGQIKTPERSSFFQNGPLTIAEHRNSPGVG